MKVIVVDEKNKNEYKINKVIEWAIYILAYAIVLLLTSNLFRALYIKNFLYGVLASVIIYVLNKTIKPVLITISLPLIGLSLGLFYFVINLIILLIVDLVLGSGFDLNGLIAPFIISVFISVFNLIVDNLIIKPLIERCKE